MKPHKSPRIKQKSIRGDSGDSWPVWNRGNRQRTDCFLALPYFMFFRMFGMVVEKLFVADLQKVSGTSEKKICAAGVTRILTESPVMIGQYEHLWAKLLQALIGLFELPEDDSVPADEHFIEIEDTPGM